MGGFKRNTQAEESAFVLIPKDSVLCVGIDSVDPYINTLTSGDSKGRLADKYKLTLVVLEPGDYYGKKTKLSVSALIERNQVGSEVTIDAYGNSKKYIDFMKALDPTVTDDTVPSPETDDDINTFANNTFLGKVVVMTFGTYKFKNDEGEVITINTIKTMRNAPAIEAPSEELLEALKPNITAWQAQSLAGTESGTADGFNPDDFVGGEEDDVEEETTE